MANSGFELLSVIVCDDVRTEIGGKQSAYGLYDDEMLVDTFPAFIPKLCFRITIRIAKPGAKKGRLTISGDGHELVSFDGTIPKDAFGTTGAGALLFVVAPAQIPKATNYSIRLGLDGKKPIELAKFHVRLPKNAAEKAKIKR